MAEILAPVVVVVFILLVLLTVVHIAYERGAQPIRRLKPGTYNILGALDYTTDTVLIAVSWHADYGHYEYRLARLPRRIFRGRPAEDYSRLQVHRRAGGPEYEPKLA